MPEYLSPGVYVEEVDAGPKPIEGVSTSTVGAVGVTAFGPTSGKPELVTNFAEFVRKFGGFLPEPDSATVNKWLSASDGGQWWQFPLAIKGFFDNGGQRVYVKRVFSSQAVAASCSIGQGVVSELESDVAGTSTTLKLRHLIGIAVTRDGANVSLRIYRGDTGAQIGAGFNITAYNPNTREVTLNNAVGVPLLVKRGDFAEVFPRTASPVSPANTTLKFSAKSRGYWGNALTVRVRPMVSASFRVLADPVAGGNIARTTISAAAQPGATTISVASVAGFSNADRVLIAGHEYTLSNVSPDPSATLSQAANAGDQSITVAGGNLANGDTIEIGGTVYMLSNQNNNTFDIAPAVPAGAGLAIGAEVRKLPRTFDITPAVPPGDPWNAGTAVQRVRKANTPNASDKINVWGAASLYKGAVVELDNGTGKEIFTINGIAGDTVTLSANVLGSYFEGHNLRLVEAEVSVRYAPDGGTPTIETFSSLRLIKDGSASNLINQINTRSSLVEVSEGTAYSNGLATFPGAPNGAWQTLANGDDQLASLSSDDFVGADAGSGNRTGIQALEDIDEISISVAPGMWASTIHSALVQHCETLKDRFAILDPQDGLSIEGIRSFREPIDTKYAALYYPWVEMRDPSVKQNVNVAPSGHMAGIYARVDVERGVHKAPANEVIRGITKLADDVTKREHDMLNPKNINVLRYFPGRGYRVWGARVLTSDASWKYINVRRLFIFVEESIDEGTQWVVFEPNDEPLWARVRQTITNFLTTVWRSGALQGSKPDEAFFVRCDYSTMTQDDIDNGRLICQIGIAPVKPAEFVIFRIQQKTIESQPS